MNFPTLFFCCGCPSNIVARFSYHKIDRWELQHKDHDFATHISNIFFKAIQTIIQQVSNCAWVCIRKGELKGKKLCAKDVKGMSNLNKFLQSPVGYHSLKIYVFPDYVENMKKDIFAMIRQLGPPTFFVTFTSTDHLWQPLCNALEHLHSKHASKPFENILAETIDSKIRKNLVTCSRYYKHRFNAFLTLLKNNKNIFGEVMDYFFVTEFQSRGNEHDHGLLWIRNAPIYGHSSNTTIEHFIDNYLSCDSTLLSEDLERLQTHHHTHTCKKNKKATCRFGFPLPPLDGTMIIHPLDCVQEETKEKAKNLFLVLQEKRYSKTMSFDTFLQELGMSMEEYIVLIRSSISSPTILLKIRPFNVWINPFAKTVPQLWLANADAQCILDSYAAATYCSSYMAKFDRTLTEAFRKIREESTESRDDTIQVIRKLGNALLNFQEMSSRQAVHIVLPLALHCSSLRTIFINTSPH